MKAIGIKTSLPIEDENSFLEFETHKPIPNEYDILVKIKAISVNPADYRVRKNAAVNIILDTPKILGWDAAGIVEEVGDKVHLFKKGDEVYYSGEEGRPGSNAEYQIVHEKIAALKPKSLSFAEAAAMPLTAITAWEVLFDRLNIEKDEKNESVLIIGGAGGVGSVAIQLLKKLTSLQVIATASREDSISWCTKMGADVVINHKNIISELKSLNIENVKYILNFANNDSHWETMNQIIQPQGKIASIVPFLNKVDMNLLFRKSVSFHWELVFTRATHKTKDLIRQHEILKTVARLLDHKILVTTLTETHEGLTVENIRKAHAKLESGTTIGKIVVTV